jgi:tetratricopeptide (TPR) repeat protein
MVDSIRHYDISLALAREMGDNSGVSTILNNLGVIYLDRGEYQKASGVFRECWELFREKGHQEGEAISAANLGEALKELGDYTESDRLYLAAASYAQSQQSRYFLCHFLSGRADLKLRQGIDLEALALADEALGLAGELNIPSISYNCRLLKARLKAKQDIPEACLDLRSLAEDFPEPEQKAETFFWLYTTGREESYRLTAMELYRALDTDPENRLIKDKIHFLESGN